MKKAAGLLILILFFANGYGQNMWVKKPNLTSFSWAQKRVTRILDSMSGLWQNSTLNTVTCPLTLNAASVLN